MKNRVELFTVLDLIDNIGAEDTKKSLFGFECPRNIDIENFLKNNFIFFYTLS